MYDEVQLVVIAVTSELVEEEEIDLGGDVSAATALFGRDGILDSMGLVSLLISVEQALEDKYAVRISLADEKALSQAHSPYRTVSSLAEYAVGELSAGHGHG